MGKFQDKNIKSISNILKKRQEVSFAYLFGSQAKGKAGPLSDLDIAVFFNHKVSKDERNSIRYDIKDEIEIALEMPDKVDVIPLNDAQPLLEREVVYKGKIIYNKDDEARAHYEAGAIGRWLDWKWYDDQFGKAIMKNLEKPVKPYLWQINK
ncbi:MAG: nucleotidyltransferase domain-containing protein [Parcubacteria group bacterium]|nr:nucleotidyltransferase domain-containing protein [Parcubacteria group bacterium]